MARLPEPRSVEVVWRAFELDAGAPRVLPAQPYAERLARKYRTPVADGQAMIDRMTSLAAGDGLAFRFDRIRPGNTFDAHRILHLALERGVQGVVKERFLRGYMTEGEPIGEPETLVRLSVEAGLAVDEVERVLATEAYASAVRADEAEARRLGIHAVPFFVLGGRHGVSGAQPVELLREALTQALAGAPEPPVADGAACGPEGCD